MIATNLLTSGSSPADAASYATASVAPGADRLVTVFVYGKRTGGSSAPTLSGGGITTWVQVATTVAQAAGDRRLTMFRGMSASPGSGAITIDFGGVTQSMCAWIVCEFSGVKPTGSEGADAVVQSAVNNADGVNSLAVTLGSFADASNNVALGAHAKTNSGEALALDGSGGYAELVEVTESGSGDQVVMQLEWKTGQDTSVSASHTGSTRNYGGIAVEVAIAVAVSGRQTIARGVGRGVGRGMR